MQSKRIKIGGASGYWGDAAGATEQLLLSGDLDFIVYDYLAEITMSIMARARAKDPSKGYALDFVSTAMGENLARIANGGVRIISNAGGVNPSTCASALRALVQAQGLTLKVACVTGDDMLADGATLSEQEFVEMFTGEPFPDVEKIQSINAYLGAFAIARALDDGADIVVTGRCVDSAVTLAACIHQFGWRADDYDKLAQGSLAGHILECGTQATGGNFTDWEALSGEIDRLGYPIADIGENGDFVCTKAPNTGGVVSVGTVAEQMLYEIGDPQAYLLPDVSCDFSNVVVHQVAPNKVSVTGARGYAPSSAYKVSATYLDEYRGGTFMTYYGIDAPKKARAQAEAIFRAARRELKRLGMSDFSKTSVEVIGEGSQYGEFSTIVNQREVVLKIAAKHPQPNAIDILFKVAVGLGLATPPSLSGFQAARPKASPVVRLFSFLLDKDRVNIEIEVEGESQSFSDARVSASTQSLPKRPVPPTLPSDISTTTLPLVALAFGRSGDKGDKANIGIIARRADYLPYIYAALSEAVVAARFAHFLGEMGPSGVQVQRFLMPGANAINFLLHDVLDGGGIASLRNDPQAKGYAQVLLDTPISVSQAIADEINVKKEGV